MACAKQFCGFMIRSAERLLLQSLLEAPGTSNREGLLSNMYITFLLFVASGCFLVEGFLSTDLKELGEIVKRLEAKIEEQEAKREIQGAKIVRQDAEINELHSKNERMETKAN